MRLAVLLLVAILLGGCATPLDWLPWGGGGGGGGIDGDSPGQAQVVHAWTGLLRTVGLILLLVLILVPQSTTAIGNALTAIFNGIAARFTKKDRNDEAE